MNEQNFRRDEMKDGDHLSYNMSPRETNDTEYNKERDYSEEYYVPPFKP